jgi:hypothetical protein
MRVLGVLSSLVWTRGTKSTSTSQHYDTVCPNVYIVTRTANGSDHLRLTTTVLYFPCIVTGVLAVSVVSSVSS